MKLDAFSKVHVCMLVYCNPWIKEKLQIRSNLHDHVQL